MVILFIKDSRAHSIHKGQYEILIQILLNKELNELKIKNKKPYVVPTKDIELFEKLTATPEKVECTKCGSLNTEKQFNGTYAFKVTGGGAYDKHMKVAK